MTPSKTASVRAVSVLSIQLSVAIPVSINVQSAPLNKSITKSSDSYKKGWDNVAWGTPSGKR